MKKNFTLSLALMLILCAGKNVLAQSILYHTDFDASSQLPSGWYATPSSWWVDTTGGNSSTGAYVGASGLNNVVIQDTVAARGNDQLVTSNISTTGFSNITLQWGCRVSKHFEDSGSHMSLYWSVNGGGWNALTYTENSPNSAWSLDNNGTAIALPSGAANAASLQIQWLGGIHFNLSGTYRIDDVVVEGTSTAGIDEPGAAAFARIYTTSNSTVMVALEQQPQAPYQLMVCDLTGRVVYQTEMETQSLAIPKGNLVEGIYLVRLSNAAQNMISKVLIK